MSSSQLVGDINSAQMVANHQLFLFFGEREVVALLQPDAAKLRFM